MANPSYATESVTEYPTHHFKKKRRKEGKDKKREGNGRTEKVEHRGR